MVIVILWIFSPCCIVGNLYCVVGFNLELYIIRKIFVRIIFDSLAY